MVVSRLGKVIGKTPINYGEVAFRREDGGDEVNIPELGDFLGGGGGKKPEDIPPTKTQEELDAEAKAIADAKVIADAKAKADAEGGTGDDDVKLDANGNPIKDDEGTETDEEFQARLLETYKGDGFNEAGDIVLKDGTVVKKVADITEYNENDQTLISEIQATLGYEINGEDGKPKQYEDTVEGMGIYTQDVADVIANEKIDTFISSFPEVKSLYNHLTTGGTVADFVSTEKDWDKVVLTNDNKEQNKNIIREDFMNKGIDPKLIDSMITSFEDGGTLLDTAKMSKTALKEYKTNADTAREKQITDEANAQAQRVQEYWTEAKQVISTGKLKNVAIPKKDVDAFYDYVSKAVDNQGNSQESIDRSKEDMETRMMMSFWRYKGYDMSKLVKSLVAQDKVDTLRKRISTREAHSKRTIIKGKMGSGNEMDLDLDKFLGK